MAQINGISIKGRKEFKGHEGESCTQGNLYIGKTCVGYYSDSFMMGPVDIDIMPQYREEFYRRISEYWKKEADEGRYEEGKYYEEDGMFMYTLNQLFDLEKYFKKAIKSGGIGIAVDVDNMYLGLYYIYKMEGFEDVLKEHPTMKLISDASYFTVM